MLVTKTTQQLSQYTYQKNRIWYFSRRVPNDLRLHYRVGRIACSSRTRSVREASSRAMNDAAKLDRHWHIMRSSSDEVPGKQTFAAADLKVSYAEKTPIRRS